MASKNQSLLGHWVRIDDEMSLGFEGQCWVTCRKCGWAAQGFNRAKELADLGLSEPAIAARTGVDRNTVRKDLGKPRKPVEKQQPGQEKPQVRALQAAESQQQGNSLRLLT